MSSLTANARSINGATSGAGQPIDFSERGTRHSFYTEVTGTLSGGKAQWETARDQNFQGTWAPIGDEITLASNTTFFVSRDDIYVWVRCRLTVAISGGPATLTASVTSLASA